MGFYFMPDTESTVRKEAVSPGARTDIPVARNRQDKVSRFLLPSYKLLKVRRIRIWERECGKTRRDTAW